MLFHMVHHFTCLVCQSATYLPAWDNCKCAIRKHLQKVKKNNLALCSSLAIRHVCAVLSTCHADAWRCANLWRLHPTSGSPHWPSWASTEDWGWWGRVWRSQEGCFLEWEQNRQRTVPESGRQGVEGVCQISTPVPKWHRAAFGCSHLFISAPFPEVCSLESGWEHMY